MRKRIGTVTEHGGGYITVFVDRDLDNYPALGEVVYTDDTPEMTYEEAAVWADSTRRKT